MTANDHAPTISRSLGRWLIVFGVCVTAAGVLASFQLERRSFVSTTDFQFRFLTDAFLPLLVLGLLTTLIGSLLWAWRAAIRDLALFGLGIIILMFMLLSQALISVHGWTGALLPVSAAGMLIGGLFLAFAVVRTIVQYLAKSR